MSRNNNKLINLKRLRPNKNKSPQNKRKTQNNKNNKKIQKPLPKKAQKKFLVFKKAQIN